MIDHEAAPRPREVVAWNVALLVTAFVNTGFTSVVPQRLFEGRAGPHAQEWLAATLALGTGAAIAGVAFARRHGFSSHPARGAAVAMGLLLVASACGLAAGIPLLAIPLVHALARGVANHVQQEVDRRALACAARAGRQLNDRVGTTARLCGMLLGPLWFGLAGAHFAANVAMLAVLGAACIPGLRQLLRAPPPPPPQATARLTGWDRQLHLAAIAAYAGYYLLASNAVFVLRSAGVSDPAARAGALIAVVYASAAVAAALVGKLLPRADVPLRAGLAAPLALALCAALLSAPSRSSWAPALVAAVVLGAAFGVFLLAVRGHVTRAVQAGTAAWQPAFNALGNTSAVLGFGMMAAAVATARVLAVSHEATLRAGLVLLALAAIVLFARRPPRNV